MRDPSPTDEDPSSYPADLGAYMEGARVYITASWNKEQIQLGTVPLMFTIGNVSTGGNRMYKNVPLESNTRYGYFIRYIIENDADPENVRRSTFHSDYFYNDFVSYSLTTTTQRLS